MRIIELKKEPTNYQIKKTKLKKAYVLNFFLSILLTIFFYFFFQPHFVFFKLLTVTLSFIFSYITLNILFIHAIYSFPKRLNGIILNILSPVLPAVFLNNMQIYPIWKYITIYILLVIILFVAGHLISDYKLSDSDRKFYNTYKRLIRINQYFADFTSKGINLRKLFLVEHNLLGLSTIFHVYGLEYPQNILVDIMIKDDGLYFSTPNQNSYFLDRKNIVEIYKLNEEELINGISDKSVLDNLIYTTRYFVVIKMINDGTESFIIFQHNGKFGCDSRDLLNYNRYVQAINTINLNNVRNMIN